MALQSKNTFTKGMNLDLDELRVPPDVAVWIKDMTLGININQSAPALSGSDALVRTPTEGNQAITVTPPYASGTNYCIGTYSSEQTNELYYFLWNSNNLHSVWVIDGTTAGVTKVYQGALLPFILDPQYFISEGRCTLELRSVTDPVTLLETTYKFLIFTNNNVNQCYIEVNSSVATNSFSTPYFTATAAFYNPLELIHLGVPTPLKNIQFNTPTAYVPTAADLTIQNLLVRNGWQFRIKFIDIFGRESEHGIISDQYITVIGGGCITASNDLPRCMMLNFDAGNPLVNQIQVEYRQWIGDDRAGALATGWLVYEVFNKYDNSSGVEWYNRGYNPLFTVAGSGMTFNSGTNTIAYTFCADKNSIPIDPNETSRTEPGLPRSSASVFSINKRIGLANNIRDFNPVAPDMVDKVVFGVQNPATSPCPAAPTRTIVFYANLWRPFDDSTTHGRKSYGKYVFGDADNGDCATGGTAAQRARISSFKAGQVFGDQKNPGFIAYLAGTPYKCVAQQVDYDIVTGSYTVQGLDLTVATFPHTPMWRFEFTDVPAGKYIARLASHKSTINDPDYQKTSTYVGGILPLYDITIPGQRAIDMALYPYKELEIDCTGGDIDLKNNTDPMFLILDQACHTYCRGGAVDGYLIESTGGSPVEMNPIEIGGTTATGTPSDGYGSFFTDHNGFFFCASRDKPHITIWTDLCDGLGMRIVHDFTGGNACMVHNPGSPTDTANCYKEFGTWHPGNALVLSANSTAFDNGARRVIKQKFFTCADHTIGVPGIPVVMTKCGVTVSNGSGLAEIIAHNRYNYGSSFPGHTLPYLGTYVPDFGMSPYSQDKLIISQKGGCQWVVCGGCDSSMADITINYLACGEPSVGCTGTQPPRTTCKPDIYLDLTGIGLFGCQTGGKYPVAFWLHDVIGRHTAPMIRQGQNAFVTMPNLNDVGYRQFALPGINVTIDPAFVVDPIFTKMTFLVGANILFTDFFSWGADWVQPIDNTGETNSTNPTAIRIYYGSLNEYNKQNNFSTNTGWQFLTNNNPQEGDVVQFIMNGDGAWLTSVISAPVSYDSAGLFFTIPYLPELAGLKNNCLFRVIRPAKNQSGEFVPLYEQSLTIPLVNGVPQTLSFVLPYFDSYLLSRLLPVPRLKGQPYSISPTSFPATPSRIQYTSSNQDATLYTSGYSTSNVNNKNGVVIFEVLDDSVSYPFLFESPSPADTWGSHLASRGRVGFPNPYAEQQRIGTEIALSDALGARGTFNGLGYFESQNVQIFDKNAWGNISMVLAEVGVCLVICETDRFTIEYNQSQLRVNEQGVVLAQNSQGIFTSPQRKVGQSYGCVQSNINTIQKYGGVVIWLDNKGHLIFDTFGESTPTEHQGYMGYLLNKIAVVNIANRNQGANGKTYFVGCIDPKNMEYILTSFNIPASGSPSYVNTLTQPSLTANETYIFDLHTGMMKNSASYTAEYYGRFPGYYLQRNFISFKAGKPYSNHNNFAHIVAPPPYANYFGTQCLPRVTFVTNADAERVKRYLWIEVYCKEAIAGAPGTLATSLFLADVITTEKLQLSRILTPLWVIRDGYSTAFFICDLNTPADPNLPKQTGVNKARDGNPLIGRWCKVSLVTQSSYAGTYFELSGSNVYINGVQKPDQKG